MNRKNYAKTRQVLDFNSLITRTGEYTILCVPIVAVYAAREFLTTRGRWPSTYAKSYTQDYYIAPTDTELEPLLSDYAEFVEATHEMNCNDFLDGLADIAASIRNSSCCTAGGPGVITVGGDTYYGNETPLSEPTVFGPGEEFATETEYQSHKCQAANAIVDGLVATLNNFSLITLVNLTGASVLAGIAFMYFTSPPVAVFLTILALGLTLGVFSTVASAVEQNRGDLVCSVFSSTSATEAYNALHGGVRSLTVDAGFAEIEVGAIMDVIERLGSIDALNNLYRGVGLPAVNNPVDCAVCGCVDFYLSYGSWDGSQLGGVSEPSCPGRYLANLYFNTEDGSTFCGPAETVKISVSGGAFVSDGCNSFIVSLRDQSNQVLYSFNDTSWDGQIYTGVAHIVVTSGSDFNMLVEVL